MTDWEFGYEDKHFEWVRDLIGTKTGIVLSDRKKGLVYNRVVKRIRELRLATFDDYFTRLKNDSDGEAVLFTNALTTNHTFFFREEGHFTLLADKILPSIAKAKKSQGPIRIWCSASSTGQEPYTIAMVCQEFMNKSPHEIQITATDIDTKVLDTARKGVYRASEADAISVERRKRWLYRGTGANADKIRVRPELQSIVDFQQLNLMESWSLNGTFDIIFCRNVVIYFDKPTQKRLFGRMSELQRNGDFLLIGHSESLHGVSDDYELIAHSTYRKK